MPPSRSMTNGPMSGPADGSIVGAVAGPQSDAIAGPQTDPRVDPVNDAVSQAIDSAVSRAVGALKATRYDLDGPVATVWLHRPHRHNAWTGRMYTEYRAILAALDAEDSVRVVVVTGTPPAFCVGGDSSALAGHAERGAYDSGVPVTAPTPGYGIQPEFDADLAWQFGLRVPVIAAVNGACAGVGLALALFCDLRFANANAKLTTAAPKLGLPAEYGMSWILPRLVGATRAADLLLSGRVVTGAETADWGLWNGVANGSEETLAAARDYAHQMATTASPAAVAATKRQLTRDLTHHNVGASVEESKRLMNEMMAEADYREGVAALREKRAPRFTTRADGGTPPSE